jgi:hypothetical protein
MTAALLLLSCIESGLSSGPEAPHQDGALRARPGHLDFGELEPAERSVQQVLVENVGGATLRVLPSLSPATGFELLDAEAFELRAGQERALSVELTASTWEHRGLLTLDSDQDQVLVELSGVGLVPGLSISPDPLDFGVVPPGVPATASLWLENVGAAPLALQDLLLEGEVFALVQAPDLPLTLEPDQQLELPLRLLSDEPGAFEGRLWATSDAQPVSSSVAVQALVEGPGLSGAICDPSGGGLVAGAEVTIWLDRDGDGLTEDGVPDLTDGDGHFELANLVPGTWTVTVEKGSFHTQFVAEVPDSGMRELPEPQCLEADSVELAVVQGSYDSIEVLLAELALEPDVYAGEDRLALLSDPEAMAAYDVVFLNCGLPEGLSERKDELAPALRAYVAEGGNLYASDHAFELVEAAWPQAIDFANDDTQPHQVRVGFEQSLVASVLDPNLQALLGSSAELTYDIDLWAVVVAPGAGTQVLMSGSPDSLDGVYTEAPLLLRFFSGGQVLFTTFHNDSQITPDMRRALYEVVLEL